mgnify:CR=1 FL=1
MNWVDLWYSGTAWYRAGTLAIAVFGASAFFILFFVSAPYGRHHRAGWGPSISARLGWLVMEAPSFIGFIALAWVVQLSGVALAIGLLFALHYLYRAFIFPFRMKGGDKPKPLLTVGLAVLFNTVNGAANAYDLGRVDDWSVIGIGLGVGLFVLGVVINHHSDAVLLRLRAPGQTGYKIPYGGLFRFVSAPNYFGEIIQWIGFAVAAATPSAALFAAFTVCNLLPRAQSHHRWYQEQFSTYPPERKRLIPYIW